MPKRKATGPAQSDGEDDDCYQDAPAKLPSPFPKFGGGFSSNTAAFGGDTLRSVSSDGKPSALPGNKSQTIGSQLTSSEPSFLGGGGSGSQEFSKTWRDLNLSFRSAVRNAVSKNPTFSLLPLVKDYLYHSRVHLESSRKGGAPLNGVSLPPKDFKSLGEFFDDLEKQYIEQSPTSTATLANASSLITKSIVPGITSGKPVVNSSSPLPLSLTKSAEPSKPVVSAVALNSVSSSSTTSIATAPKLAVSSPNFFGIRPSSPPSVPSAAPSASLSLPSTSAPPVSKPTPFTGFSFFTPPSQSSSSLSLTPASAPAPKPETKEDEEEGDDEDQPPKVEVIQVKEDDAVYSKRCKVFGIVDGKPKDKGIGMLYIKKLESGRYQIVVRADNNLGTVLLNILLQKSLPLNKNKNTVTTVDPLANDKKGMPIIIKVKTEDDATELLAKLKEFQQAS